MTAGGPGWTDLSGKQYFPGAHINVERKEKLLFCPPSVARWAEVGEGGSGGKLKLRQKVGGVGDR